MPAPYQHGLVGLFGHAFDEQGALTYQFRVERKVDAGRYLLQLYSFLDGSPEEVRVMPESVLTGPRVKLYLTEDAWHGAYQVYDSSRG